MGEGWAGRGWPIRAGGRGVVPAGAGGRARSGCGPRGRGFETRRGREAPCPCRHHVVRSGIRLHRVRGGEQPDLEAAAEIQGDAVRAHRDGWLRGGGGLWAVQTEAPREHENVASPDPHARGSPGLRGGSNNVWCAVFNATGVRDKAQGIMEEPEHLCWWWPVYCS